MAHTGKRLRELKRLLVAAGLLLSYDKPSRPRGEQLGDELSALYRQLGGLQNAPMFAPGGWDLTFEGGLVVELDEQLHFNRYRALTLATSWSAGLPWTEAYLEQCHCHEDRCLKDGRTQQRWTNRSSARMFTGGPPCDLDGDGAPRWKQRALYDALKDSAIVCGCDLRLARLSIYDQVDGVLLDDALAAGVPGAPAAVRELLERRTAWPH
jgi:hypothetical protein